MLLGRRKKGAGAATRPRRSRSTTPPTCTARTLLAQVPRRRPLLRRPGADHGRRPDRQGDRADRDATGRVVHDDLHRRDPLGTTETRSWRSCSERSASTACTRGSPGRRDRAAAGRPAAGLRCSRNDARGAAALDRPRRRADGRVRHRRLRDAGQRRPLGLRRGDRGGHTRPGLRRPGRARRALRDDLVRLRKPDALEQPARARRGRSVREAPELADQLEDPETAIFNLHVPPYDSGLDTANEMNPDLTLKYVGVSRTRSRSAVTPSARSSRRCSRCSPSTATSTSREGRCRSAGRSRSTTGSEYNSGHIHGAVVTLDGATVRKHQFVVG